MLANLLKQKKTQRNKDYYQTKKLEILAQRKETYSKHAEEFKIASKMNYDANRHGSWRLHVQDIKSILKKIRQLL